MNNKIFSVLDFGAEKNTAKVQTDAFQKALDACFLAGGGEVVVPTGTYVVGDIRIRSNTVLHLLEDTCIKGSSNPQDYFHIYEDTLEPLPEDQRTTDRWYYPDKWISMGGGFKKYLYAAGSRWNYGLVRAVFAENIGIIGEKGARFDGSNVYDPEGEEDYRGPHGIDMHFCKNVSFKGYTFENASNWAHAIFNSENVTFQNLTVYAGHDALHTRACTKVLMENCTLITGDDCIAGFNNIDVVIRNCELSSACSAFRYGGADILVENCHAFGPCKYQFRGSFTHEEKVAGVLQSKNGRNNFVNFWTNFVTDDLPIKQPAGNIVIRNCQVENANRFLHLNLSGSELWQRGVPPTDITFENIKITDSQVGFIAYGVEGCPMTVTLKNIDFTLEKGFEKNPLMRVAHCDKLNLENIKAENFKGDALIRAWSDNIQLNFSDISCDLGDGELFTLTEDAFHIRPY